MGKLDFTCAIAQTSLHTEFPKTSVVEFGDSRGNFTFVKNFTNKKEGSADSARLFFAPFVNTTCHILRLIAKLLPFVFLMISGVIHGLSYSSAPHHMLYEKVWSIDVNVGKGRIFVRVFMFL